MVFWHFPQRTARVLRSDRKSTRLNSSHDQISYAVFCLKKKKNIKHIHKGISTLKQQRSIDKPDVDGRDDDQQSYFLDERVCLCRSRALTGTRRKIRAS